MIRYFIISFLLFIAIENYAQEEPSSTGKHEIGVNHTFFGRDETRGYAIEHRYRLPAFQLKTTLGIRPRSQSYFSTFQNFPLPNDPSYINRNSTYSEEKLFLNIGIEKDVELHPYSIFFLGADISSHFGRVYQSHSYTLYNFDSGLEEWTIGTSNNNFYQQSMQTMSLGLMITTGLKLKISERMQLIAYAAPALFVHDITSKKINETGLAQFNEDFIMSKRGYVTFSTFYGITLNYQIK